MSCLTNVVLQREQCLPSVKPVVVQVAATALSTTSLCPKAGVSSCLTNVVLQREQCLPSVFPVVVQVAATASSLTSICPRAVIASVFVAPQSAREQVKVFTPSCKQSAAFVSEPLFQECPSADTIFCLTNTASQTEQCLPSVLPVVVHVAAIALSITIVCASV